MDYTVVSENGLPIQFKNWNDKYLLTQEKNSIIAFPFDCEKGIVVTLNDELLMTARNYLYKKATLEIKQLLPKKVYQRISKEKDEILYYTGRILPSQEFNGEPNLSEVCIERFSPLAYALVNEVHWYNTDAKHTGNETVTRYVQKVAHIIEGRSIIKKF